MIDWRVGAWVAALAVATSACHGDTSRPSSLETVSRPLSKVPLVSAEIGTDAPILGPSRASQYTPTAASDGSGYLVVWNDSREGGGIWASRLDAAGGLLDKTGIVVRDGPWTVEPEVSFDGSSYVVFWGHQAATPKGVFAVRVKPDGSVLDDPPIAISPTGIAGGITHGDACSLAVWSESQSGANHIYARRIGQAGQLLGSAASHVAQNANDPDVAFDGSTYLVAWQDTAAIRAVRLTSAAVVLDPTPILVTSGAHGRPAVAAGATGFVVTWTDPVVWNTQLARVTPSGTVLDPGGITTSKSGSEHDVGFDGTSFLSVFMGAAADDVYGVRVAASGVLLDSGPLAISSGPENQEAPRIASRIGEHLVVWASSDFGTANDVSGRRVASNGTLIGTQQLSFALGANEQLSPAVASDGKDFLLVWQDHRGPGSDLFAERIASDGSVLDPSVIPVAAASGDQEEPEVAFDGTQYLAVWEDRRDGELDIYGGRIDKTGKLLDPGGFPIASSTTAETFPALAWNGSVSLVVWSRGGGFEPDVHGARVAPDGSVLDPTGFVIAEGPGAQSGPGVGSDGTDFLVVWSHTDQKSYVAKSTELRAARYASNGTLLTPTPIVLAAAPGRRSAPRVAFGNGVYLVVWHDERHALVNSADWDVYATRVTPTGAVLDAKGIRVTQAPGEDAWADVAWDGSTFVVAWAAAGDKRAVRIDAAGTLLDPGGFVLSPGNQWPETVLVAANGLGTTLAGYQRYDSASDFRSNRVRARTITFVDAPDSGIGPDASDASNEAASVDAASDAQGESGTGGSGGAAGNAGSSGMAPPTKVPIDDDGGCGCRTPRRAPADWSPRSLALALGACLCRARLTARRRRPAASSAATLLGPGDRARW